METKCIGANFLHSHPMEEKAVNLHKNHVIVDRYDWEIIIDFFSKNPDIMNDLMIYKNSKVIHKFQ